MFPIMSRRSLRCNTAERCRDAPPFWPSDKIAVSDHVFCKIRYASALPFGGIFLSPDAANHLDRR
jgi:hypothetical protein